MFHLTDHDLKKTAKRMVEVCRNNISNGVTDKGAFLVLEHFFAEVVANKNKGGTIH